MNKVVTLLTEAKLRLTPDTIVLNPCHLMEDSKGNALCTNDARASRFCLVGAIFATPVNDETMDAIMDAERYLWKAAEDRGFNLRVDATVENLQKMHEIYDAAIAIAEASHGTR